MRANFSFILLLLSLKAVSQDTLHSMLYLKADLTNGYYRRETVCFGAYIDKSMPVSPRVQIELGNTLNWHIGTSVTRRKYVAKNTDETLSTTMMDLELGLALRPKSKRRLSMSLSLLAVIPFQLSRKNSTCYYMGKGLGTYQMDVFHRDKVMIQNEFHLNYGIGNDLFLSAGAGVRVYRSTYYNDVDGFVHAFLGIGKKFRVKRISNSPYKLRVEEKQAQT